MSNRSGTGSATEDDQTGRGVEDLACNIDARAARVSRDLVLTDVQGGCRFPATCDPAAQTVDTIALRVAATAAGGTSQCRLTIPGLAREAEAEA